MLERREPEGSASVHQGAVVIAIIDYGAGNLRSVCNALDEVGAVYRVLAEPAPLGDASKIILPGVGHFGQMMRALDQRGFRLPLLDRLRVGVPFLGICLGLQALFESSEEALDERGLGIFPGRIRRFREGRVPQMGWNSLEAVRASRLLDGLAPRPYVYFANSFYADECDATSSVANYGVRYTAILERDNIAAVQFHPEKSGPCGLRLVKNFVHAG
jgi:imidazole glycerol phosphate synthase glutamine amidotransferase subunit